MIVYQPFNSNFNLISKMSTENPLKETSEGLFFIYIFSSSDFEDLAGVDALLLKQRKNS